MYNIQPEGLVFTIAPYRSRDVLRHSEHTTTHAASLGASSLTLHFLRHFHIDFEEFGHATIYAYTFCFVKITLSVISRYALF